MEKVIISLVISSIIAAAGAFVNVVRLEQKVMFQNEKINRIDKSVEWIRVNLSKR